MRNIYIIILLFVMSMVFATPASAVKWTGYRIALDPGHGGTDPGASGPSAPHEAELCLRAALSLRTKLQALGAPVKMTRTANTTLSLTARRNIFRNYDPYISISMHLNAFNKVAHGTETWYYWSTGNSKSLAQKVQTSLVKELGRANRGVKQNGWTVITASSAMPACLTEGLFVDNRTEWEMINATSKAGFNNWVNGHLYGCYDHLVRFNSNLDNPRTNTPPPPAPSITTSPTSLNFSTCPTNTTKTADFSVTGKNLSSNITITSNSSNFKVSKSSLGTSGGTITVTFDPTAAMAYSGIITVKSGTTSKTVSLSGTGTTPPATPSITVTPTTLSFTCHTNTTKTATFTVKGSSLGANIAVSSNHSLFTVSPSSLPTSGGTVTVTFKPTNPNTYTGTVTVKSGSVSKTVSLTGKGTTPPVNLSLVEKWNFSQQKGTLASMGWNASQVRNMAYGYNGRLYMIYDHAKVKVVMSQTGKELYDLPNSGVTGGALTLCDVIHFNGKMIACNLGDDTRPLKIYVWDSDISAPRVLLETTNLGGAKRLGDCIGVTGTWTSGKIAFANDDGTTTRIVSYAVTNGVCSKTPTVVNATTDGTKQLVCSSSIRVNPDANGFWINGKHNVLTRLDKTGKQLYEVDQESVLGNGFSAFQYKDVTFAVLSTFTGPGDYVGGAMELVNAANGWANTVAAGVYPREGLGTTKNTNCTGNSIALSDGNNVETWILSTGQGIAYYTAGSPTVYPEPTPDPSIVLSPASLSITCPSNETKVATFSVTGENLTSSITVTSNSSNFTVSPSSLDNTGGDVTVTFKPAAETTYSGTVTVKSGTVTKTVSLTGTGTVAGGSVTPPSELSLVEKWNFSEQKSSLTTKGWDASKVRNMTYGNNGKLYLVYEQTKIKVVTSQTGEQLYDLSNTGVAGGTITLCDVAHFDGKTIACNLASNTSPLKVYVWDTDTSTPRVLLETASLGGAIRLGDCIGVTGTWTSGKIVFAHDDGTATRIISYPITNGVCSTTPTVVNATTDGTKQLVCSSSIRVQPDASGYWINGKHNVLTRLDLSGKKTLDVSQSNTFGNGFAEFNYQGVTFGVLSTFNGSENYTGGCMELVNASQGWDKTTVMGTYPMAGLGATPNTGCTGSCLASSDGTNVEAWILSTGQGIAYYTSGTSSPTSPEGAISVSDSYLDINCLYTETKTASFTVTGENLSSGITVSSNSSNFTVSPSSLAKTGGTVTVTFIPTAEESYSGTVTLESGDISESVSLTGTGTSAPAGELSLIEKWNFSEQKSSLTTKGWDASKVRNMAYGYNGKLYLIYDQAIVKVVMSQTGKELYDLPNAGVGGGTFHLCDVAHFDGKIIASNLTTSAATPLKVYVWDGDTSQPRVLLETTNLGGATRLGDCIGVTGNWDTGKIVFANDDETTTRIVSYAIIDGVCSTTPTVVNVTTDGVKRLACGASIRVQPDATGYWINGQHNVLTRLDLSGKKTYEVSQGNTFGNGFSSFQYQGETFAVLSTFINGSTTYSGGHMELVNASQGWVNTTPVGTYPSEGLGTTRNINCAGNCFADSDGTNVEAWILSYQQGIAYYTHGHPYEYSEEEEELITDIKSDNSNNLFSLSVADNVLTIKGMDVSQIHIYSLVGHKVLSAKGNNVPLQVGRGVYVVIASDFDGNVKNGKIIVD